MELKEIVENFNVDSPLKTSTQLFAGHINITQLIELENGEKYILQRMNKYVFKDPVGLMHNIISVTSFMRKQYLDNNLNPDKYVLNFVTTKNGLYYYIDQDLEYWRMYHYIDNSDTYYAVDNLKIVYETGKAFGKFQVALSKFDASILNETIPNFHNTIDRFNNLKISYNKDIKHRANEVKDIYDEFLSYEELALKMTKMLNEGVLPLRVTHNDTKCNNVLIENDTYLGLAVIDLDTIMPGLAGFDFGDSIRSGSATAAEDETDLSKVSCDIDKFKSYALGFLSETKDSLTKAELDTLALGAFNMTIECGARFLTDYLDGDKYFKTKYDRHNLDRAINQLHMAKDILSKKDVLDKIINDIVNNGE